MISKCMFDNCYDKSLLFGYRTQLEFGEIDKNIV